MKKIIAILLLSITMIALTAVSANAQISFSRTSTSGVAKDTLTNADTITHSINASPFCNTAIQIDVKLSSGTFGGKAYLYGSVNNIGYILVDSSATYVANGLGSQYSKVWTITSAPYSFWKVVSYGSGTAKQLPKVYGSFTPLYNKPF